ncbi:MAG: hypothetical protein PHC51_08535 [bacterium]|nr:hypothetical protein [bacterium]
MSSLKLLLLRLSSLLEGSRSRTIGVNFTVLITVVLVVVALIFWQEKSVERVSFGNCAEAQQQDYFREIRVPMLGAYGCLGVEAFSNRSKDRVCLAMKGVAVFDKPAMYRNSYAMDFSDPEELELKAGSMFAGCPFTKDDVVKGKVFRKNPEKRFMRWDEWLSFDEKKNVIYYWRYVP